MTTFHQDGTGFIAYTKGAPETVLDRCKWVTEYERRVVADKERPLAAIEAMASEGLRVLAVACRRWDELPLDDDPGKVEQDLTLLNLVGLLDPPRPEAKQAVATCKCAGITPVMITGDHAVTARHRRHDRNSRRRRYGPNRPRTVSDLRRGPRRADWTDPHLCPSSIRRRSLGSSQPFRAAANSWL